MYDTKVKFSVTNTYGNHPYGEDDIYDVETFKSYCEDSAFIDDDGWGHPVKDGLSDESITIIPSKLDRIPFDATHIIWFNR